MGEPKRGRLDRSAWLDAALDTLHDEGIHEVKVERIAARLGVTKGSFYHHFSDRRALLLAMIERWRSTQEGYLRGLAEFEASGADERLKRLLHWVSSKDGSHDVGMRAWARTDPAAREAVIFVDGIRVRYVEDVLRGIGFDGDEVRLRARMLYLYQVGEQTWSIRDPEGMRRRLYALHRDLLERAGGRRRRKVEPDDSPTQG